MIIKCESVKVNSEVKNHPSPSAYNSVTSTVTQANTLSIANESMAGSNRNLPSSSNSGLLSALCLEELSNRGSKVGAFVLENARKAKKVSDHELASFKGPIASNDEIIEDPDEASPESIDLGLLDPAAEVLLEGTVYRLKPGVSFNYI